MYGYIIHCMLLPKPKMGHFLWYWSNSYLAKQPAFTLHKYMYYRNKILKQRSLSWQSDTQHILSLLYLRGSRPILLNKNQSRTPHRSFYALCTRKSRYNNTFLFSFFCKSFFLNFNKLKSVPLLCIKCQTKSVLVFQYKITILITQN